MLLTTSLHLVLRLMAMIFLTILPLLSIAQNYPIYTYPEGTFPNLGKVNAIYQDRQGFLWIGGERGAIRYDGHEFRRYSVADGLYDNFTYNFAEAPDGKIWICTWRGVSLFDPVSGQIKPHPEWGNTSVRNVAFIGDSMVVAATDGGLHLRYKHGLYVLVWAPHLQNLRASNLAEDVLYDSNTETIWLATEINGILALKASDLIRMWEFKDKSLQKEYDSKPFTEFHKDHPDLRLGWKHYMLRTADSTLFVDIGGRYSELMSKAYSPRSHERMGERFLANLQLDRSGNLWMLSRTAGIFRKIGGDYIPQPQFTKLAGSLNYFRIERSGEIILGGEKGLFIIRANDTLHLSRNSGLPTDEVFAGFKDQQGNYWIATVERTLHKLVTSALTIYDEADFPRLKGVSSAMALKDGSILLAGKNGLSRYNEKELVACSFQPRSGDPVLGMSLDRNGALIYVTDRAIYHVKNGQQRVLADSLDTGYERAIFSLDQTGKLWICAGWYLGTWDGKVLREEKELGLMARFSNFIYACPDSSILLSNWIYLFRYAAPYLIKFDNTVVQRVNVFDPLLTETTLRERENPPYFVDRVITCGQRQKEDVYWLGTFSGKIVRLEGDSAATYHPPENVGRFNSSYRAEDGTIYFLASEGVVTVKNETLEMVRPEIGGTPQYNQMLINDEGERFYATSDGLCIETAQFTIMLDRDFGLPDEEVISVIPTEDRKYMIVQPNGISILDWEELEMSKSQERPLVLTSLNAGDVGLVVGNSLRLPLGNRQLKIEWALTDFNDERQNRYEWSMEGLKNAASRPSGVSEANFVHLPPGEYKFHLTGYGSFGQKTELDPPLTVIVPARFYETMWFWLVLVTLGFVIGFGTLERKLIQMRSAKANLEVHLAETEKVLHEAEEEVKMLTGMIPICSNCKKVRDDSGFWQQVEKYIAERTEAKFSHGICPECIKLLYPEYYHERFLHR